MLVFTYLHIWLRVKATFHPKNVKQNTYLRYLKIKKECRNLPQTTM